jgi:hypothetical protein
MFFFGKHSWRGESGERYMFKAALTNRSIPDEGGIYIFVRRRFAFFLHPLYIGKATNLRSRIFGHERWWEAWWKRGATERHILVVRSGEDRARIEEDLIRYYQPRMNDMLVPRTANDEPHDRTLRKSWRFRRWLKKTLSFGLLKFAP